ncbi:MAG: hypothetical protein JNK05_09610 [Myxococcales bacterium]|nr:hypothetical protein [Myxococcales bacterium]
MIEDDYHARLKSFLKRVTQQGYLALYASSLVQKEGPDAIAADLPQRLGALEQHVDPALSVKKNVNMTVSDVRALLPTIPNFIVDLLIVDLEANLHLFLSDLAGIDRSATAQSFENLLAKVWPRDARTKPDKTNLEQGEHWSYRQVILLSVIRNAIVHNGGHLDLLRVAARLRDACWTDDEIRDVVRMRERRIDDLFRFKRAVRTLANSALLHVETSAEQR